MNTRYGVIISVLLLANNTAYGAKAYVTNINGNSVSVFDTTTNAVTKKITDTSFDEPQQIAVTPDGTTAYVVNESPINLTPSVTVINVATDTIAQVITDASFSTPFGIAITPDGKTAYVTNAGINTVSVIDIASNTVTPIMDASFINSQGIAITPDGTKAYVANFDGNSVSIISIPSNTVTEVTDLVTPTFNGPLLIAITPDGKTAYVTNNNDASVSVINVLTDTVTQTVTDLSSTFSGPFGVAISPDGTKAYVTNDGFTGNTVSVIDVATNSVNAITPTILRPNFHTPGGVVFTQDGATAYVANTNVINASVSIINVANNTVTAQGVVTDQSPKTFNRPAFIAIVPTAVPPTPTAGITVSGVQRKNIFLTQTDYINIITWTTPTNVTPVTYKLYRDAALTNLAGTVTANGPLQFNDHNRNPKLTYTYYLVAVDQAENSTLLGNVTVAGQPFGFASS